jgi:hypothetical protein
MAAMYRRAYALLVGVAFVMATAAIVTALSVDKRLADPDGFLGPAWVRLPLLLAGAFLLDLVPRALWFSRFRWSAMAPIVRERLRTHWTRERITLVVLGVVCFYVTYVSYRNLKSFLPFVITRKYDRELYLIDRTLLFGHEPGPLLHSLLGQGFAAHILSTIYLWFLPLVPLALTAWLIWSRNITFGYWFATSQVLAWSLGTASYYALPTLGPGFEYSWLYEDLANTGSTQLMRALQNGRQSILFDSIQGAVQSVAGFASLHCAITLLVALMVQYTLRSRILHWLFWANFAVTVVATLYFGWHYIADDIAGVVIALFSFYLGGIASGQKFDRAGLGSHPTSDSSKVPVDQST